MESHNISKIIRFLKQPSMLLKTRYLSKFLKNHENTCNIVVLNINLDILRHQETILFCYTTKALSTNFDHDDILHPNILHANQMLNELIRLDFSIDICHCNDLSAINKIKHRKYDYILGFGEVYKYAVNNNLAKTKILFITENNPTVVQIEYQKRIAYFRQRHPSISIQKFKQRNAFYDIEQFEKSDIGICITSNYNALSMMPYFKKFYRMDINGLQNIAITKDETFLSVKNRNFVWFGSNGLIHKGLDILIDAFTQIPEVELNVYGVDPNELYLIKRIIPSNVKIKGRISVYSHEFINEVVKKNTFVISISCSEGMQSGIATCMLHGLIPVVNKETGFDLDSSIFLELESFNLDNVVIKLKQFIQIPEQELKIMSKNAYTYANHKFTLSNFSSSFHKIISEIKFNKL